jgi:hypothetical protein
MPLSNKPWSFLAYIAGDNNLSDAGIEDIRELCLTGSNAKVHAAVQIDTHGEHDGSIRYQINEKEDGETEAFRTVIARLRESDSGNPRVLKNFLKWGITRYPADHRLVVIWNHGSGFRAVRRDIAYDDFGSSLDMPEIISAFEKAKIGPTGKIAVLGFDACLMNMLEIAHHFQDQAEVLVGSQQTEPGDGWPYDKVLAAMHENPTPEALGKRIVEAYIEDYAAHDVPNITQSAIVLEQTSAAVEALGRLGARLATALADPKLRHAIRAARLSVQSYEYADYVDLVHLAMLLRETAALAAEADAVIQTVSECVIANGKIGPDVENSHGLSVWFPTSTSQYSQYRAKYLMLKCNKPSSGWVTFLDAYFQ